MRKIYHISQVAEKINRSKQTIQRWIKEGLLEPERNDRGWHIFTEGDIERLEEIKRQELQIRASGIGHIKEDDEGGSID